MSQNMQCKYAMPVAGNHNIFSPCVVDCSQGWVVCLLLTSQTNKWQQQYVAA